MAYAEGFIDQCGATVIYGLYHADSREDIPEKQLKSFKETLDSCVKIRKKAKTKQKPAFVQEILVVVTIRFSQAGWEEVLKEYGFKEVSCWVNYNYGHRTAKQWNKMYVLQSFDKETMV